jgi:hypothetical protein
MQRSKASIATPEIWPTSSAPAAPFRRAQGTIQGIKRGTKQATEHDNSIGGVLIFCGIGLALTVLAAIFQWLELPPPYF